MLMNIMPILSRRRSAGIRHNIAQFCQERFCKGWTDAHVRTEWTFGIDPLAATLSKP